MFVTIPQNERTRDKWDLEENLGFVSFYHNGKIYKVRNTGNDVDNTIMHYLGFIDQYYQKIKEEIYKCRTLGNCRNEAILFVKTPTDFQEIPVNNIFEGVNKPKFIIRCDNDGLYFAKDNDYRATRRHIMLSLRTKQGKPRSWSSVKKLLLHELAHTMCNHCTYREEGNHQEDFNKSENFLKELVSSSVPLREMEQKGIYFL